ncbi:MAG: precorrin-2 C(20)-methyltransferase [Actinomycetota bacterium]|nr:precorrin-2 C(20)-methyltransferase [Actinomycetota bacterium]
MTFDVSPTSVAPGVTTGARDSAGATGSGPVASRGAAIANRVGDGKEAGAQMAVISARGVPGSGIVTAAGRAGGAHTDALGRAELVGVGVGPGDPALLTVQALGVLRSVDRVVAPTTAIDAPGRAETIVRQAAPEVVVDRLPFDMSPDHADGGTGYAMRSASHRTAAQDIVASITRGQRVAFVTLGDPNVYSTFPSVAAEVRALRPQTVVATVPGICAFQVLAARAGTVLTDGVQRMALVTALDGPDHAAAALADDDCAVVIYKGGRHLPALCTLLAQRGRLDGAVVGELLGLPGELVAPVAAVGGRGASYLATVIVPPRRRAGP